jgi:hypothetical protein
MKNTFSWLYDLTKEKFMEKDYFPLKALADGSVYYPSSGLDGSPIQNLNDLSSSFIYADYGIKEGELETEIRNTGLKGYEVFAQKFVPAQLLISSDYSPSEVPDPEIDKRYFVECFKEEFRCKRLYSRSVKPFYACWTVFSRMDGFDDDHGPPRLSLLFLCAEAVTMYDVIYNHNNVKPVGFCIIRPGTGLGGNWTDFRDPKQIMYRIVSKNRAGKPSFMMVIFGGDEWPEYQKLEVECNKQEAQRRLPLYWLTQ